MCVFPEKEGNVDEAVQNVRGARAMKNIRNIFLILVLALPMVGFAISGLQGLLITMLVLLFCDRFLFCLPDVLKDVGI